MSNIVNLEQVKRDVTLASGTPSSDTVPEFIKPRSIVDMTDTEQDAFLLELRNRRLRAQQIIKEQREAAAAVESAKARDKIERKIAMCMRAEERVGKAIEKLEAELFSLRALVLMNE